MRLVMSRMLAMKSQARVRRATHRLGKTSKPLALSDLRMISRFQVPILPGALRSFAPEYRKVDLRELPIDHWCCGRF